MVTDPYKAVSCQFSFARVHSYFVKRANLPINYNSISDFSPIWNNRRSSSSRNLNNRGSSTSYQPANKNYGPVGLKTGRSNYTILFLVKT